MTRIRLKDRQLPDYTKGEEIFNMVSHIVGGAIGIAALVLCVIRAALRGNAYGVVGSAIYGASMILLYSMSSIYHGLRKGTAKKVMQVLDHCTIYVLIAGTYTPILLSAMRPIDPVWSWVLFGVVWGVSAAAIALTAIDLHQFRILSMVCYISLGWACVIQMGLLIEAVTVAGALWLLAGGISYTVGAVIYAKGKQRRWMHSVFHVFVIIGSLCQFIAIYFYAL